jgi:hypothetical protein
LASVFTGFFSGLGRFAGGLIPCRLFLSLLNQLIGIGCPGLNQLRLFGFGRRRLLLLLLDLFSC